MLIFNHQPWPRRCSQPKQPIRARTRSWNVTGELEPSNSSYKPLKFLLTASGSSVHPLSTWNARSSILETLPNPRRLLIAAVGSWRYSNTDNCPHLPRRPSWGSSDRQIYSRKLASVLRWPVASSSNVEWSNWNYKRQLDTSSEPAERAIYCRPNNMRRVRSNPSEGLVLQALQVNRSFKVRGLPSRCKRHFRVVFWLLSRWPHWAFTTMVSNQSKMSKVQSFVRIRLTALQWTWINEKDFKVWPSSSFTLCHLMNPRQPLWILKLPSSVINSSNTQRFSHR